MPAIYIFIIAIASVCLIVSLIWLAIDNRIAKKEFNDMFS